MQFLNLLASTSTAYVHPSIYIFVQVKTRIQNSTKRFTVIMIITGPAKVHITHDSRDIQHLERKYMLSSTSIKLWLKYENSNNMKYTCFLFHMLQYLVQKSHLL